MATRPPKLSKADWTRNKDEIIQIYKRDGLKKVMETMKEKNFHADEHNYNYHFKTWNVKKYTRKEKTEELFDKVLDSYKHNRPPPQLTSKELDKLRRRYKKEEKNGSLDPVLKNLLQQMRDLSLNPGDSRLANRDLEGQESEESDVRPEVSMDEAPEESFDFDSTEEPESEFEILEDPSQDETALHRNQENPASSVPRLRLSSSGRSAELEEVLRLTRAHYQFGIQHYRDSAVYSMESDTTPDQGKLVASLSLNKAFWTKIKSAIYYFKMGKAHEDLAITSLQESSDMVPILCEQQPFSIWKDMFATLSPINIAVRREIFSSLLSSFTACASEKCAQYPNHPFPLICSRLEKEDLFHEASTAGLQVLLELSRKLLPPGHNETYEVERTLIRLLRRQGRLADAKRLSKSFIKRSETIHGRHSVEARLAMTELVYILNDEGRYRESIGLAKTIVRRCKQDRGEDGSPPDQRCVFAMEDVAYVYEKLGQMEEAIYWLRRAQKDAIKLWKDKEGTEHINRKLEEAFAKVDQEI